MYSQVECSVELILTKLRQPNNNLLSTIMVIMIIMFIIIQICPELKENLVAHVQSFTPHQVNSMILFALPREPVLDYVDIRAVFV